MSAATCRLPDRDRTLNPSINTNHSPRSEIAGTPFEEVRLVEKGPAFKIDTGNVENSIEKAKVSVEKAQKSYDDT